MNKLLLITAVLSLFSCASNSQKDMSERLPSQVGNIGTATIQEKMLVATSSLRDPFIEEGLVLFVNQADEALRKYNCLKIQSGYQVIKNAKVRFLSPKYTPGEWNVSLKTKCFDPSVKNIKFGMSLGGDDGNRMDIDVYKTDGSMESIKLCDHNYEEEYRIEYCHEPKAMKPLKNKSATF